MTISLEEVRKISHLARIKITPDEEKRYSETISAVLDYMKILNEVNTDQVEPTFQVTGLNNVVRMDVPVEYRAKEELIKIFPKKLENELVVPGVFATEEE